MDKPFNELVILNDALRDVAKHISFNGYSYRPLFVKMDRYGNDCSFQAFYSRETSSGFSTSNFLFKVRGTDFDDMMSNFLNTYHKLMDLGYISPTAPHRWLHKSIKLEY